MKRIISIMLCGFMMFSMAACASGGGETSATTAATSADNPDNTVTTAEGTTTEATPTEEVYKPVVSEPRDTSRGYRVLFIGNSFTYYNDMNKPNGIFYQIAKNAGYNVTVDSVYKGGYYLHQFLNEKDEYGAQALNLLSTVKYDIVILQDQSASPISNPGNFYDSCRRFKELIDKNGAEMWIYETWGYKDGYKGLPPYGKDTFDMEMKLRAGCAAIGKELGVPVAYAGAAFSQSYKDHPEIELYYTDIKHPGVMGSYLVAWTLFGTIFGVDPATLTYDGTVNAEYAKILREVASDIIKNGAPVDAAYALSSEGVTAPKTDEFVDASKTQMLTSLPKSDLLSVIVRDSNVQGDGWVTYYGNNGKTFSGIRGDKDKIASPECSGTELTEDQKKDIADIGYGVSVIGISHMDGTQKGAVNTTNTAGDKTHSVINLVNGHWGSSYMASIFFDSDTYNINGEKDVLSHYTGLITLNFGEKVSFDAIGYMSGSLKGFAQAQDVYVSDDGVNWTKVESACYDAFLTPLKSVDVSTMKDPWKGNTAKVGVMFSMAGYSGKYIRIGIYRGGIIEANATGLQEINTREIVVFGKKTVS